MGADSVSVSELLSSCVDGDDRTAFDVIFMIIRDVVSERRRFDLSVPHRAQVQLSGPSTRRRRPVNLDSEYWPGNDNKYAHVPEEDVPRSECLKDTIDRTLPYWDGAIVPALKRGKTVLIAAHGNSIRGMVKALLDNIGDSEIVGSRNPDGRAALISFGC